jgi:hypothetical protein
MGLAGLPPSVGMVKSVAEEIAYYCHKDTNYDPLTVVLKLGINWMARFQDRNPSILAMYTRSRNIKRLKGVVPEKVQPFYDALFCLLATSIFPRISTIWTKPAALLATCSARRC